MVPAIIHLWQFPRCFPLSDPITGQKREGAPQKSWKLHFLSGSRPTKHQRSLRASMAVWCVRKNRPFYPAGMSSVTREKASRWLSSSDSAPGSGQKKSHQKSGYLDIWNLKWPFLVARRKVLQDGKTSHRSIANGSWRMPCRG